MKREYVITALESSGWEPKNKYDAEVGIYGYYHGDMYKHPGQPDVTIHVNKRSLVVHGRVKTVWDKWMTMPLNLIVTDSSGWFKAGPLGFQFDHTVL